MRSSQPCRWASVSASASLTPASKRPRPLSIHSVLSSRAMSSSTPPCSGHHLPVVAGRAAAHAERHAMARASGGTRAPPRRAVCGTTISSAALPSSSRLRIGEYQ
jgi:hypothetical protein